MNPLGRLCCILIVCVPAISWAASAADWATLPRLSQPVLSVDGERVAMIRRSGDSQAVEVLAWQTGQRLTAFESKEFSIEQIAWLSRERLLIAIRKPGGLRQWLAVERNGFAPRRLTRSRPDEAHRAGSDLLDLQLNDPLHILLTDDQRLPWQPDVYRVNVYTGDSQRVEINSGRTWVWKTDRRGELRLRGDYLPVPDGLAYQWFWQAKAGYGWRPFFSHLLGAPGIEPIGFDGDNRNLLVLSDLASAARGLYRFDPAASELGDALFQHSEVNVDGLRFSARTGQPASVDVHAGLPETRVLEADWRRWLGNVRQHLPAGELRILGTAAEDRVLLIEQYSARDPGRYWIYQPQSQALKALGERMPGLSDLPMRPTHAISLKGRDGLDLSGYLTLPTGEGPHPLVVYVHGGPWLRDRWGFDPMVQMLAADGLAVLKLNFRGSAGFGREFLMAGQRQWGRAMQDDLVDAVNWARKKGHASDQVCVMGMSYGGYAALMGVLRDPKIFNCAVAYAPVTDLSGLIEDFRQRGDHKSYAEWRAMVGIPGRADHELSRISPLLLANQLSRPVLLLHGAKDRVVPEHHSEQFLQAGPSRMIGFTPLENTGHQLDQPGNRKTYFVSVKQFLTTQLGLSSSIDQ